MQIKDGSLFFVSGFNIKVIGNKLYNWDGKLTYKINLDLPSTISKAKVIVINLCENKENKQLDNAQF